MSVKDELQAIYEQHGRLTPSIVLDEATDPEHPLHGRFTWEDGEAARRWRLHQAQALIRSVNVVIEKRDDAPPIVVRAFVSEADIGRGTDDGDLAETGAYIPVTTVIESDVLRTAWFRALQRDWESLKRRAGDSKEFAQMVLEDMREHAG